MIVRGTNNGVIEFPSRIQSPTNPHDVVVEETDSVDTYDTQARPTREDLLALADGCDLLILPTTPSILALDALLLTVEELKNLDIQKFKILITMIPPPPQTLGEEARKLIADLKLPLFKSSVRRFVAFEKAMIEGTTIDKVKDDRAQEGWADYQEVGKEILRSIR